MEKLDLEQIAQLRTVHPEGLNQSLDFYSRYEFAAWYKVHRIKDFETRGKEEGDNEGVVGASRDKTTTLV